MTLVIGIGSGLIAGGLFSIAAALNSICTEMRATRRQSDRRNS